MDEDIDATGVVEDEQPAKKGRAKWVIGGFAALLVILGGLYVAGYFVAGDKVPAKAEVKGVAIGGMSPDEAVAKLQDELGPQFAGDLTVADEQGTSVALAPADSGLTPDFEAAVHEAGGGFSWNPLDIIHTLTGGSAVDLPLNVDDGQLKAALTDVAPEFAVEAVDATISFEGTEVVTTEGKQSSELDVDATATAVADAYRAHETDAEAALKHEDPAVTTEMVESVATDFAEPATSGPIKVQVAEETSFEVTPEQIVAATIFTTDSEGVTPEVDYEAIVEATQETRDDLDLDEAKDASYKLEDGTITVVPAKDGVTVDTENMAEELEKVITETGEARTISVGTTEKKAEFTTEQAEELKPTEIISEFSTEYPHAAYRNTNIGRAAELMNGTVILPGETFSFNNTLGERTPENGFTDGYVIDGGVLVKASGGGISQAATTAFNAGFFAGFEDVEHKPHSLYFPRYPAGREATVVWGGVDLKFKNNTEYPAVIQSWVNQSSPGTRGKITVRVWSQKTWEKITATDTVRSNYTNGRDREVSDPRCEPQAPIQGFTASYKRQFWKDGAVAKEEPFSWTYSPGDRIICR